ncbi:porin [Novosphingobium flavum]|uniref:Porin n=1 Tax=Novosphingobium flavum TaxID=1778672 RepID=A0A7X1KMA1_9SPHN|nr:porin [Novosphingobium flavum]MBC2666090.1 porin [Novosphingobium flavum]
MTGRRTAGHGRISRSLKGLLLAGAIGFAPLPAKAGEQDEAIAALRSELAVLRAEMESLRARLPASATPPKAKSPATEPAGRVPAAPQLAQAPANPVPAPAAAAPKKGWYDRIQVRGYVQMRANEALSGPIDAPTGLARLRSVHDSSVGERGTFSLRRARIVIQGDLSDKVSLYLQGDLASAVNAQSSGERREHFFQMRDAYADLFLLDRRLKLRFGQSKVPFGWENLQSSSNRIAIDRADAANSAVPGERDLGVVAYFTPRSVQAIWDRLGRDGQKLFGNYGAIGLGVFNGQGINRTEKNDSLMQVAMVSWPFALDGLGEAFAGQVIEIGAQGMLNRVQPELRSGGVNPVSIAERRVNLHAVLYPAPFGLQAEWSWGRGPEWDPSTQSIASRPLSGGYIQAMARVTNSPLGALMPYARWQHYRGGWKAAINAPRLETNEIELGVEFQPLKELELTLAYARMKRAEADERRAGRAVGDLLRAQLQWNY